MMLCLTSIVPQSLQAFSGLDPTLLVNTESFELIDSNDSTVSTDLRFGTSSQTLKFLTTSKFQFSHSLSVLGSISGSSLTVDGVSSFSGAAVFKRNATIRGTLSGATFFGAGLGDCGNSTTSKIVYDSTNGKFICATDQNSGGGSGLSFTSAEGIYVNQKGDTMTGTLVIGNSKHLQVAGTISGGTLKILGTSSGNVIHAEKDLTSSGTLTVNGATLIKGATTVRSTISGTTLRVSGNADVQGSLTASGGVRTDGNITINDDADTNNAVLTFGNSTANQTLTFLNTTQRFQFSKSLSIVGSISGASLTVDGVSSFSGASMFKGNATVRGTLSGATFFGAGLGDCGNSTTSKIVYDSTNGKFICATDQNSGGGSGLSFTSAEGIYVNQGGDTMTGALTINLTSGFLGLKILQTASGNIFHAEKTLTSSGLLMVTQQTVRGSGALVVQQLRSATGAYIIGSGSHVRAPLLALDSSTGSTKAPHILFGYNGTFDTNLFRSAANVLKTSSHFNVVGTLSGARVHAEKDLTSSGTLMVGSGANFKYEPHLVGNLLPPQQFAVSCDVESGADIGGIAIPNECYAWIIFPAPYTATPTTVTLTAGAATGGATAIVVGTKTRTGFQAHWSCDDTIGECGYLGPSYTVTP